MRPAKARYQVKKTEKVIVKIQELKKQYNRLTEFVQSIEWHLMRHPHRFNFLTDEYFLLSTGQLENPAFPALKVLYVINPSEWIVTIIDISD